MSSDVQNDGIFCQLPIWKALPNELAIQCLARLPRRDRAIARCVSRSWRDVLSPNHLKSFCQALGIHVPAEDWLYISYKVYPSKPRTQIVVDPLTMQKHPVTVVDSPPEESIRSLAVKDRLSVVKCRCDCLDLYRVANSYNNKDFECISCDVKPMIEAKRRDYAWAVIGNFVYVAGGFRDGDRNALRSAERFDMEKQRWEMLPPMVEKAKLCSGFVIKGKFYVMYTTCNFSLNISTRLTVEKTQCFDPESGEWRLAKDMWEYTPQLHGRLDKPKVAVVQNKLYKRGADRKSVWEYNVNGRRWRWEKTFDLGVGIHALVCVGEKLWALITCRTALRHNFISQIVNVHNPIQHMNTIQCPRILFSHYNNIELGTWRVEAF